jgi:hypothetical protein
MKKKIFSVLNHVESLLHTHPHLRDSDRKLISTIWWRYIGKPESLTGMEILKLYADGILPETESISRCRRKLQEEKAELRGELWNKRHKAETEVINELEEIKTYLNQEN